MGGTAPRGKTGSSRAARRPRSEAGRTGSSVLGQLDPHGGLQLFGLLEGAGYDLEDERQVPRGLLAAQAALLLHAWLPAAAAARLDGGPPPHPRLIPRLADAAALRTDARRLVGLLGEAPSLRTLRCASAELTCLSARLASAPPSGGAVSFAELLATLVECRAAPLPADLVSSFGAAAGEVATDLDGLRSLVLGILGGLYGGEGPSPLLPLLVLASARERAADDGPHRLLPEDTWLDAAVQGLIAAMDRAVADRAERRARAQAEPELVAAAFALGERLQAGVDEALRSGCFPVRLPYATLLPLLIPVRLAGSGLDEVGFRELLDRAVQAVEAEDLRLYSVVLGHWLEAHAGEASLSLLRAVGVQLLLCQGRAPGPIGRVPLVDALQHGGSCVLDGEAELLARLARDHALPSFLEDFGDLLDGQGYPSLARRTRRLGELLGPLLATVWEDIPADDGDPVGPVEVASSEDAL